LKSTAFLLTLALTSVLAVLTDFFSDFFSAFLSDLAIVEETKVRVEAEFSVRNFRDSQALRQPIALPSRTNVRLGGKL
jgi:hypothetical protein